MHRGLSFRIVALTGVGTLPSGQRKLDHILGRNAPWRESGALTLLGDSTEHRPQSSANSHQVSSP